MSTKIPQKSCKNPIKRKKPPAEAGGFNQGASTYSFRVQGSLSGENEANLANFLVNFATNQAARRDYSNP
jgi:hypothetical protein